MLHQGDIITIVLVDLCSVEFAEAVRADPFISQVVASHFQNGLHRAFTDRENPIFLTDPISQAVIFNVLVNGEGDCEGSGLTRLLLLNVQPVSVTVFNNVGQAQLQDVTDPEPKISFQHQS